MLSLADILEAKMIALVGSVVPLCASMVIGFSLLLVGFRAIGRSIYKITDPDNEGNLFNLEEVVGFVAIFIVVSSFSLIATGLRSTFTYVNSYTKPGSGPMAQMEKNSLKLMDAQVKGQMEHLVATEDEYVDDLVNNYKKNQQDDDMFGWDQQRLEMDIMMHHATVKKYKAYLEYINQGIEEGRDVSAYSVMEDEAEQQKYDEYKKYMEGEADWTDIGAIMEKTFQDFFHWVFRGIASVIRWIVSAIAAYSLMVMMVLGPFAFAASILIRGLYMHWIRYTLSLGLVNLVFNILDHFMAINLDVFQYNSGNGNTFELLGFDIVMIAMYIMAFKLIGKVVGDGTGGGIASKSIAIGGALAMGAVGGAMGMGALASKGFKGFGDFAKQIGKATAGNKYAKDAMDTK